MANRHELEIQGFFPIQIKRLEHLADLYPYLEFTDDNGETVLQGDDDTFIPDRYEPYEFQLLQNVLFDLRNDFDEKMTFDKAVQSRDPKTAIPINRPNDQYRIMERKYADENGKFTFSMYDGGPFNGVVEISCFSTLIDEEVFSVVEQLRVATDGSFAYSKNSNNESLGSTMELAYVCNDSLTAINASSFIRSKELLEKYLEI